MTSRPMPRALPFYLVVLRVAGTLLAMTAYAALVTVALREVFDIEYLESYLKTAPIVNLAGAFAWKWGFTEKDDDRPISANPIVYLGAWATFATAILAEFAALRAATRPRQAGGWARVPYKAPEEPDPVTIPESLTLRVRTGQRALEQQMTEVGRTNPAAAAILARAAEQRAREDAAAAAADAAARGAEVRRQRFGRWVDRYDSTLSLVVLGALSCFIGLWLAFSLVPQYLVFLIAGALPRAALASSVRPYVGIGPKNVSIDWVPSGTTPAEGSSLIGPASAPVSSTLAIAALLVFVVNYLR